MVLFPQDPMLARHVARLPEPSALAGGCVYEPKLDGYRAMLFVTEEGCRVQSRRGHDITGEFQDVADAAAQELPAGVVLDGELVVWAAGAPDFGELQRRLGRAGKQRIGQKPASFVAFDILSAADNDVRSAPLHVRRQLLETVMDGASPTLQLCAQTDDIAVAQEWMAQFSVSDLGMEGLVVKGRDTAYRNGAREWLKYRVRDTVEVVVGGVTGSVDAPGHLVLGLPDGDGVLSFAGTTTELSPAQRREVAELLHPSDTEHAWLLDVGTRWGRAGRQTVVPVVATLVVEISVDSSVQDGRWRHPVKLVRARPDLVPAEVQVRD
jgi:ATP-dependent DNA ligase